MVGSQNWWHRVAPAQSASKSTAVGDEPVMVTPSSRSFLNDFAASEKSAAGVFGVRVSQSTAYAFVHSHPNVLALFVFDKGSAGAILVIGRCWPISPVILSLYRPTANVKRSTCKGSMAAFW